LFNTLGLYAQSVADLELLADVFDIYDDTPADPSFQIKDASIAFAQKGGSVLMQELKK
jgi:hypothetical protein